MKEQSGSHRRVDAGRGIRILQVDSDLVGRSVAVGEALVYDVRPHRGDMTDRADESEWWSGGFGATGVSVELVFQDESSTAGAPDQYGVPTTANSQGASRLIRCDQWNRRSVALDDFAGRVIRTVYITLDVRVDAASVDLGSVSLRRPDSPTDWTHLADTTRGTNSTFGYSRGNTVPATAVPHGFALTFPVTDLRHGSWPSVYGDPAEDVPFLGVRLGHTPSPWIGDYGVLDIQPTVTPDSGPDLFERPRQRAHPHRYEVVLRSGIELRLAPTRSGMVSEMRYPHEYGALHVHGSGGHAMSVQRPAGRTLLTGCSMGASPVLAGAPPVYWSVVVDRAVEVSSGCAAHGTDCTVMRWTRGSGPITVSVATSLVAAGVAEAASAQLGAGAAATAREAERLWDEIMSRFRPSGATQDQLVSFYSSLYRLFLYPSRIGDPGLLGETFAARAVGGPDGVRCTGALTVNNGFWDTYRTVWPALALFDPARAAGLLDGLLNHFRIAGWMPRWTAPMAIDIMVGTGSDVVFADSLVRGVELDEHTALAAGLKNATVPSADSAVGRRELERAIFLGFTPADVPESVSWTIENAISDAATEAVVDRLRTRGETEFLGIDLATLGRYLRSRARTHANTFDSASGFYRPVVRGGGFAEPFDPREWGGAYTETNAWGTAFAAMHDPWAMQSLHGGPSGLRRKLDEYFASPEFLDCAYEGTYGMRIHEMTEAYDVRMGMFALSNQPAHHIPFLYAFTDRPWKTSAITRAALRRQFTGSDIGQGYPGDEDNGEMSAWYLFAALGFYPVAPGSAWYVLTAPLLDRVEIDLPGGMLSVVCENNTSENDFIQEVRFDGVRWESPFIEHERLAGGGELRFVLGPTPVNPGPASAPAMGPTIPGEQPRPLRDLSPGHVRAMHKGYRVLEDDSSVTEASFASERTLHWRQDLPPARVEMYTLTCGNDPNCAPTDWTLWGSDDGVTWEELDERRGFAFQWPRQTVPFPVREGVGQAFLRLVVGAGNLAQIEFLGDTTCAWKEAPHVGEYSVGGSPCTPTDLGRMR
ncbi:GH92 family glycosyl hydrolase [Ruania rhizosphaerae]|uniref:GH92 family glycosyl hydrolase n=1 Tax=Ruania rhizosphaerae TaxID=1840413 RepID=UPI00135C05AE|nr:GH92 family glycosyl hydrolase [Ruania rhizosphaerae]